MVELHADVAVRASPVRFARLYRERFLRHTSIHHRAHPGPFPDPWQAELLESQHRNIILNCSRQVGKSSITALKAGHHLATTPGGLVLITSPSERQSQELLLKLRQALRLTQLVVPSRETTTMLELPNEARCFALPGHEKTIRSFSAVTMLIIDEASRVDDALYEGVSPMLAVSGGQTLLLSTPWYEAGFFYNVWQEGGDEWQRFEVPATMCQRIPPQWLEGKRKTMSEAAFAREYMCRFQKLEGLALALEWFDRAVGKAELVPIGKLRQTPADPNFTPWFGGQVS